MNNDVQLVINTQDDAEQEAVALVEQAKAIAVTNDTEYETAGAFLVTASAVKKEMEEFFGPLVRKAHEAHKALTAARSETIAPVDKARSIVKSRMAAYVEERERVAKAKALAEAEEARRAAEAEALATATALSEQGRDREADAVLDNIEQAPVGSIAVAAPPPPTAAGTSTVDRWHFEVLNARLLNPAFLVPNEQAIRQVVNATKDATAAVNVLGGPAAVRVWRTKEVRG